MRGCSFFTGKSDVQRPTLNAQRPTPNERICGHVRCSTLGICRAVASRMRVRCFLFFCGHLQKIARPNFPKNFRNFFDRIRREQVKTQLYRKTNRLMNNKFLPGAALFIIAFTLSNLASLAQVNAQTNNTFYGEGAGRSITIGDNDSGFGYSALYNNTTGSQNTASGAFALTSNGDGRLQYGHW